MGDKGSKVVREVAVATVALAPYRQFGEEICKEVERYATGLRNKKILHINSTAQGGGVAELLRSQVGIEKGLGIASRWVVIHPDPAFFVVTKKIHNLLQGSEGELTSSELDLYTSQSASLAEGLAAEVAEHTPDLLIVHDPQPLLASAALPVPKVLRLHIDLCQPNESAMAWLCGQVGRFNHVIISRQDCVLPCLADMAVTEIPPAIDPLAPKNVPLSDTKARDMVKFFGIDPDRPLVTQVSRFDVWKDPLGVIEAYRIAKRWVPDVQLALVGFLDAVDDPEAHQYIELVREAAASDPDIHLFFDPAQLKNMANDEFVNAMQVASAVVMQKSVREGFGLTVTEAMWKGKPVIGGDTGGIRLQITSGENGILIDSPAKAGEALVQLLSASATERRRLGTAARTSVQARFLMPRFVRDNLNVYARAMPE